MYRWSQSLWSKEGNPRITTGSLTLIGPPKARNAAVSMFLALRLDARVLLTDGGSVIQVAEPICTAINTICDSQIFCVCSVYCCSCQKFFCPELPHLKRNFRAMARRYASHARRIRVNINVRAVSKTKTPLRQHQEAVVSPNLEYSWDASEDEDIFDGPNNEPIIDDYKLFNLLTSHGNVTYKPTWKRQRAKTYEYFSRTRDVSLAVDKDVVHGWLTWNSKHGVTLNIKSPIIYALIDQVCNDIRALEVDGDVQLDVHPLPPAYQYEEICTWIPNDDLDKVINGLPVLIRYAETMDWHIEQTRRGDRDSREPWISGRMTAAGGCRRRATRLASGC